MLITAEESLTTVKAIMTVAILDFNKTIELKTGYAEAYKIRGPLLTLTQGSPSLLLKTLPRP